MTRKTRIAATVGPAGAALVGLTAAAAGLRGAAITLVVALTLEGLAVLGAYRRPHPIDRRAARRPTLPTPAAATIRRQLGAIQMATRGPRWADTELRPQLRLVVDSLESARGQPRPGNAAERLGDSLAWFVAPDRQVRGHDEGSALSLADIEDMIRRAEELV